MEQRRLRLGDILDDYCPRERRVTNHAVVAMIEEDVKQTRCTTCDAEHAYKGARVPKRRRKEAPATLYQEVLTAAGMPDAEDATAMTAATVSTAPVAPAGDAPPASTLIPSPEPTARHHLTEEPQPSMNSDDSVHDGHPLAGPNPDERSPDPRSNDDQVPAQQSRDSLDGSQLLSSSDEGCENRENDGSMVDGPVHRRLIRATLPRPEGQKDARPAPEFTVRQSLARGNGQGNFRGERMRMRGSNGNGHGEPNGNRAPSKNGPRFHGGPGRQPMGRAGGPSGFRKGNGGAKGKRGRGSRG
jgi:hypothetical protein